MVGSKFSTKMNENAWIMWFNWKRKGKRDLKVLEDKYPWEICGRKR